LIYTYGTAICGCAWGGGVSSRNMSHPSVFFRIIEFIVKCKDLVNLSLCSSVVVFRCPEGFPSMLHPYSNSEYGL